MICDETTPGPRAELPSNTPRCRNRRFLVHTTLIHMNMWHRVVTILQASNAGYINGSTRAGKCPDTVMVVGEQMGEEKKGGRGMPPRRVGVKREGVLHEIFVVACAVA